MACAAIDGTSRSEWTDDERRIFEWMQKGKYKNQAEKGARKRVAMSDLLDISDRLQTQDNQFTAEPMFCVQEKKRDVGYDPAYSEGSTVWIDMEGGDYTEVPPETPGAEEFGYKDRWETVMVCFTEEGCKDYLRQNGHNHGETRIYVESFRRCSEMIRIRKWLMSIKKDEGL